MNEFLRDIRFGIRLLRKSPVFTAVAALLLAIGISANTLIFSVVDAVLLRPLPVANPERLVRLIEVHPTGFITFELPVGLYQALAERRSDLTDVFIEGEADVPFRDGASIERERIHVVSPNYFATLGVHAQLGRVLTADDDRSEAMVAVLSDSFWQRRYNRNPAILGHKIELKGYALTVVGVLPREFNGLATDTSPDIRVPASVSRFIVTPMEEVKSPAGRFFGQIFGRIRAGVSMQRADAEMEPLLRKAYDEIEEQIFPTPPGEKANRVSSSRMRLESIPNGVSVLRQQFSRGLKILMAGVGLLLLMACANVAGLLLARSAVRAREMGIRLALGAGPGRVARQLLTESLMLAILGGAAGTLLTYACLPLLVGALPPIRDRAAVVQPLAVHIDIDLRVLGFALAITLITALLFGLSPALRGARADLAATLRGGRTTTGRLAARNMVVVAQVAVCTLILTGAALLVQTLHRMRSMNAGFDRDHIVTFTIDPQIRGYKPEQARELSHKLLAQVQTMPGVSAAALASIPLMRGTGMKATYKASGARISPSDFLNTSLNSISPGYFETMGMHIVAGRDYTWQEPARDKPPAYTIVNQAFARTFFPGRNALGQLFGPRGPGGVAQPIDQIVGIVSDAKYRSLREQVPPTIYTPVVNGFDSQFVLHVRTPRAPEAIISPVRDALRALD